MRKRTGVIRRYKPFKSPFMGFCPVTAQHQKTLIMVSPHDNRGRTTARRKPKIRSYRGLGYAAKQILAAIPANRWVTAAEIAAETRISSQTVNDLINDQLLPEYVERRLERPPGVSRYLYRRL